MIRPREQRGERTPREPREFDEVVLEIRRVTRVVAGGKRFVFRASIVIGDRKGRVGIGTGRGKDVAGSIDKARTAAKKQLIHFEPKYGRTVPYDIDMKYGAARVRIKPSREGHGLVAGGAARAVLELAGVKDVSAKLLGTTSNKLNIARAVVRALQHYGITQKHTPAL